jgi:hypothetical protein
LGRVKVVYLIIAFTVYLQSPHGMKNPVLLWLLNLVFATKICWRRTSPWSEQIKFHHCLA